MCAWERTGKIHETASVLEIQLLHQLLATAQGFPFPKYLNTNMLAPCTCQSPKPIQVYMTVAVSLSAFTAVTTATDSCHLLNWDRHYPPKWYLGMEQGNDTARNNITYFDRIQSQIQNSTLLWSETPSFFSHHMILQTTIIFDMNMLSETKGEGVPTIITFSGFMLQL